jgi:lanosterol synthase
MGTAGAVNGNSNKSDQDGSIASNGHTPQVKKPTLSERTDYTRWRLLDERGRQTWHYLEDDEDVKEWPQSIPDKYFLGLPLVSIPLPRVSIHANKVTGPT